jgi:hypothetical protein
MTLNRFESFYNRLKGLGTFEKFATILIFSCWTSVASAATLTTAVTPDGQFTVSQTSGAIAFCVVTLNGSTNPVTPSGECSEIGSIVVSSTNPSITIVTPSSLSLILNSGTNPVDTAIVTNVFTGQVLACSATISNVTTVSGKCVMIGIGDL